MAAWLLLLLGWPVAAATGARWREREREELDLRSRSRKMEQ